MNKQCIGVEITILTFLAFAKSRTLPILHNAMLCWLLHWSRVKFYNFLHPHTLPGTCLAVLTVDKRRVNGLYCQPVMNVGPINVRRLYTFTYFIWLSSLSYLVSQHSRLPNCGQADSAWWPHHPHTLSCLSLQKKWPDIKRSEVLENAHLGYHDDVCEDEQGQFVALSAEGVLGSNLDSVGSTDKTEGEIFLKMIEIFLD